MTPNTYPEATISHSDLLSTEKKLSHSVVQFARNPTNQRLENGVKHRLVSLTSLQFPVIIDRLSR